MLVTVSEDMKCPTIIYLKEQISIGRKKSFFRILFAHGLRKWPRINVVKYDLGY